MTSPTPPTPPRPPRPPSRPGDDRDLPQTDETVGDEETPVPDLPLLELSDGLPRPVQDAEALAEAVADLAAGTGPVALDAERASGYRYSQRAYLIQLRRRGSRTWLVDPIDLDLTSLQAVLGPEEWVLHAASQDLACLREAGLEPTSLFDTELAARLLGYPRVGLATLVETLCGQRMKKEHSAADWSRRPLPDSWLEYAALDVEVLVEIRDRLAEELVEAGKEEWARQEFEHVMAVRPTPRTDPWRRTSGMHRARGRRAIAAVRELWLTRDRIARERDIAPGRILPDAAIVAAAAAMPADRQALLRLRGFHGRGAERYVGRWSQALDTARTLPEKELPPVALRGDGPPPPRAWADRNPAAAARLATVRPQITELAEERAVPVENLMTPDVVRRVMWEPPTAPEDELVGAVRQVLTDLGARAWQVELVSPLLIEAIVRPDPPPREVAAADEPVED